jgi:hypothetical protein
MRRTLTALALTAAAVALSAGAASAGTLLQFQNPTTGCTHTYYGPDVVVNTLPKPGVTKTGGVGASVDCP